MRVQQKKFQIINIWWIIEPTHANWIRRKHET